MIIDGHAHACGKFLTPKSIIATLDQQGVDNIVLVPGELNSTTEHTLPHLANLFPKHNVVKFTNILTKAVIKLTGKIKHIPEGNEYIYTLKNKTNNKVIQFLWITSKIEMSVIYMNKKYEKWNFKGVKLLQCWDNFTIDSFFFQEVANWTEQNNLPLFIHLYSDIEVKKIIQYKRKHLKLIIAHLFGLEYFIKYNFKDNNRYFDTSTIQLISDYRLKKAIDFVGSDRILFGTDTPYGAKNNICRNINRIKQLPISDNDKALILGLNMKKLLDIKN